MTIRKFLQPNKFALEQSFLFVGDIMCMKANCNYCKKTSWIGCGSHVPSVMDKVPKDQWCTCKGGDTYPPKAGTGEF